MQKSFFSPGRNLTSFQSSSCLPSISNFSPRPCEDSSCAVADPVTAIRNDDLRLLHPPLQLVLLSNDARFCSLTRSFLQHAGFSVYTCTTSDRAESLFLNRSDLQLWIIDVQALGIEAIYFATRLRERHPSMPILLIVGEEHDSHSLRQFLFDGWIRLTKSFDLAKMLTTINDLLTNVSKGSRVKRPKPESGFPVESSKPDWMGDVRWTNLVRMRN